MTPTLLQPATASPGPTTWRLPLTIGLSVYAVTTLMTIGGSIAAMPPRPASDPAARADLSGCAIVFRWDALWYERIASQGYSFDPNARSSVAFFPAYPLASAVLRRMTGCDLRVALLLVSHLALLASIVLLTRLAQLRTTPTTARYAAVLYGVFPAAFFHRMPYSESLFMLLVVLTVYGLCRRWPYLILAAIVGIATATRPVGVALLFGLVCYLFRERQSLTQFLQKCVVVVPVCLSGLIGYIAFQAVVFDNPWAFADTQAHWSIGLPFTTTTFEKWYALQTLEPIWCVFDSDSNRYFRHLAPAPACHVLATLCLDRVATALTVVAVGYGWYRNVLTPEETVISVLLLAIPYVTRSYEMCFFSMGRFSSVVAPAYLVYAVWAARLPVWASGLVVALSGGLFVLYTILFCSNCVVI